VRVQLSANAAEKQKQNETFVTNVQGAQHATEESTALAAVEVLVFEAQQHAKEESAAPVVLEVQEQQRRKQPENRTTKVRFEATVSAKHVPDLMELTCEQKEKLWWQPHNFDEFVAIRVELGHAYKEAARALGVPVSQVTIFGSHEHQGYKAMIEKYPQLADESRRGLGLGRKRQRAMNRDAYVEAVVEEQARQRKQTGCSTCELDANRMAAVASAVSKKDREYAARIAQSYWEQDQDHEQDFVERPQTPWGEAAVVVDIRPSLSDGSSLPDSIPTDLACILADEVICGVENEFTSQKSFPKGFGLDKQTLHRAGLSITGHPLLRKQMLRTHTSTSSPRPHSWDSGSESGASSGGETSAETDGSESIRVSSRPRRCNSEILSEESLHKKLDATELQTDARAYGSREYYRLWRKAAMDEARQKDTLPEPQSHLAG